MSSLNLQIKYIESDNICITLIFYNIIFKHHIDSKKIHASRCVLLDYKQKSNLNYLTPILAHDSFKDNKLLILGKHILIICHKNIFDIKILIYSIKTKIWSKTNQRPQNKIIIFYIKLYYRHDNIKLQNCNISCFKDFLQITRFQLIALKLK